MHAPVTSTGELQASELQFSDRPWSGAWCKDDWHWPVTGLHVLHRTCVHACTHAHLLWSFLFPLQLNTEVGSANSSCQPLGWGIAGSRDSACLSLFVLTAVPLILPCACFHSLIEPSASGPWHWYYVSVTWTLNCRLAGGSSGLH